MKKVLTSGEVARICNVAPRTATKWFDSGKLGGYKIPGTHTRRIPRIELEKFLRENGMPLDGVVDECGVLYFGGGVALHQRLREALPAAVFKEPQTCFHAGLILGSFRPMLAVLDCVVGTPCVLSVFEYLAKQALPICSSIVLANEDDQSAWSCNWTFKKPIDVDAVVAFAAQAMAEKVGAE